MTEMSEPTIRLATPEDAPALLAIYEPYVRQTAITCEYEVPSVEAVSYTHLTLPTNSLV